MTARARHDRRGAGAGRRLGAAARCGLPLALVACSPAPTPHAPPSAHAAPTPGRCPVPLDPAALLERHAHAFGSTAALAASLPHTTRFEVLAEGGFGPREVVVDRDRYRRESAQRGAYSAAGDDGAGPWSLGNHGALVRLRGDEAAEPAFDAWLARREYLGAFDPRRDEASCRVDGAGVASATLRYRLPELGEPTLTFAPDSAELVRAEAAGADGQRSATLFNEWGEPDARGVRWPTALTELSALGKQASVRQVNEKPGLVCDGVDARFKADGCLSPPTPNLRIEWPADVVRVPMRYHLGGVSLRVALDGRPAWALLDSGAGLFALDATMPAGRALRPTLRVTGAGAAQSVRMSVGEVDSLALGALTLRRLPVVSAPVPVLATFGERRPEVFVGLPMFLAAAVRVDYAKGEIVLARSASGLVGPGATSLPLRLLDSRLTVDASVEGTPGTFVVDTGSSGGATFYKPWLDERGLLGDRPALVERGQLGIGEDESAWALVRVRRFDLGPVRHDDRLATVLIPPAAGRLAGVVGNGVLARCAAVVFDVARRALWLEPPCNRPSPEPNAGWVVALSPEPAHHDRPWVLSTVFADGAAALAGLAKGDRLLTIDGEPVGPDPAKIEALAAGAPGTKLRVEYERAGKALRATLELRPLLAEAGAPRALGLRGSGERGARAAESGEGKPSNLARPPRKSGRPRGRPRLRSTSIKKLTHGGTMKVKTSIKAGPFQMGLTNLAGRKALRADGAVTPSRRPRAGRPAPPRCPADASPAGRSA